MRSAPHPHAGDGSLCGGVSGRSFATSTRAAAQLRRGGFRLALVAVILTVAAPALAADTPVLAFTTLTDSPDPVIAGETLTINVTITNSATDPGGGQDNDSTGTILSADLSGLPLGTSVGDTLPGACAIASSILTCPLGTINDAGGTASGTITLQVLASATDGGTIAIDWDLYSTEIAAPGVDGDTSTTIDTEAELAVTAQAPVATEAVPGQTLVYNVRVANAGPSDATGVELTVSSVTGLAAPTVSGACSSLPCDLTTIASGAQKDVALTYTIPDDFHLAYPATNPIAHTVTVTSDTPEPTPPGDREELFSTPVVPKANLGVALTDGITSVVAGEAITYTVTLSSAGPSRVDAVKLTGTLPALSAVNLPSEGWFSASTAADNWAGIDLANGESITMTVKGFVSPAMPGASLTASVTVVPRTGITDPTPGNDTASDSDTAISRVADLRITKTNGVSGVAQAQIVPYTIKVTNYGPSDVSGATVADSFDATRIDAVSWACSVSRTLTGTQELLDGESGVDGLDTVQATVVSPDGKHVYAAGAADNGVAAFSRAAATGLLSFIEVEKDGVGSNDGLAGAAGVAVSPDGKHVYVAGETDDAIAVFSRDAVTGALTWVEMKKDGVGGVDGLDGARGVAVAPDGRHVYAVGAVDNALAVFSRNATTGALTFLETKKDGVGGVDGLAGARAVAVSPDSRVVLVASNVDDAVASFLRNRSTGLLTWVEREKDGVGLNGLDGATALAFGPRGDSVYVAGAVDNAVVAFTVDGATGALSYMETEFDNTSGADGLLGARGVTVSPDGRYVWVSGADENEIAVFQRVTTPGGTYGTISFVESVTSENPLGSAMSPAGDQLYVAAGASSALAVFDESAGATCTASGSGLALSESVGLPAKSSVTIVADATIDALATGTLINKATVTGPGGLVDATTPLPVGICLPGDTTNNECSDSDDIGLKSDISVTKTAGSAGAVPGESLTYQVVVSNAGPATVGGVTVTDSNLTQAAFSSATWSCTAFNGAVCGAVNGSGNISQSVNLPAGGYVRYDITVQVSTSATGSACVTVPGTSCISNTATAAVPGGYIDPTPADLTDTEEIPIGRRAELSITKAVHPDTLGAGAGDPLKFLITVKNCGPSDVTGAVVKDDLPPDFIAATPTAWTCTAAHGSCPASGTGADLSTGVLVNLQAGAPGTCANAGTAVFTVTGAIDFGAEGVLTNIASILEPSGVFDPTQGNNTANARVLLSAAADVSIVKDDGATVAVPGEEIVYTITVANSGPDRAEQVSVSDIFPAILRDAKWTCDSDAPALGTLRYVGEMRDGAVLDPGEPPVIQEGLNGATDVVVAPNGLHVYATGFGDNAVVAFARDPGTGELEWLQTLVDGQDTGALDVDGLEGAAGLTMSPDGLNVYVAGSGEDEIAVFTRNTVTGELTFVQVIGDVPTPLPGLFLGLDGVRDLAVSPDGLNLYAVGELADAVAAFERNPADSGSLSFVAAVHDTDPGFDGLDQPVAVAISADGAHVYVASAGESAVTALERAAGGALTFVETLRDGDVQGVQTLDRLGGAAGVALDPDGRHLYLVAAGDDAVSVFSRNGASADVDFGRLTYLGARYEGDAGTGGAATGLAGAHGAVVSPDGQHVYVTGGDSDAVVVFQRGTATGSLKYIEDLRDGVDAPCAATGVACPVNALDGSQGVAIAPDGVHVYVAAAVDSAIAGFERAGPPPAFTFAGGQPLTSPPAPVRDGVAGVDGIDGASTVGVTSDGQYVYATGFAEGGIAAFHRIAASGELEFVNYLRDGQPLVDGLAGASGLVIVGDYVYVASQSVVQGDNAVTVFKRNVTTGALSPEQILIEGVGGVSGLFGAAGIAADPGGKHVYVASRFPGAVAVFARDQITGHLTFVEAKQTGVGGVVGLQGAQGVAVSSDGEHVYVTASVDDAVAVFARGTDSGDAATFGRLTQIQLLQAVPGLDRAIGIAVSPDPGDGSGSRNVYVTGHTADSLVVLSRNVDESSDDYGRLSAVETMTNGVDGVEGLDGARAVTVSLDGKFVYVAAEDSDALAVFAREGVGGTLVFVEARIDGADGVDGLDQAYAVATSPNGRHVYVAGFGEDALAVFSRSSGSRCSGSGVGNLLDVVDIAAGGQVVFTVTATIDPGATGNLINTAEVTVPGEITQPDDTDQQHEPGTCPGNAANAGLGLDALPNNDACRDIDTLAPKADLELIKSDGYDVAIPGEEISYTITVINDGPSNVVGAEIYDDLDAVFPAGASWTCVAAPSGTLTFLDSYHDGDEQVTPAATIDGLAGASGVAFSPDGQHAYATGIGDDAVAVFAVDDATGALTFLEAELDAPAVGIDGATSVVVSPDGAHVYVASQLADTVVVFARDDDPSDDLPADPTFGELTWLATVQYAAHPVPTVPGATLIAGLDQPVALALDPLGEHLYVAAANSNAVTVLAREANPASANYGKLTFVESQTDGVGNVDGLAGASGVAVSPDGASVYATGANEDSVVVFARNTTSGALTYAEKKSDGVGAVDGLQTPRAVAVSADGLTVYVAGAGESAVAAFARAVNGTLTFLEAERQGVAGVQGLTGVGALVVSADGFHLYAGAGGGAAIAIFRRDAATGGRLEFVDAERKGVGPVDGIEATAGLALSPTDDLLLATGRVDDAVAVFRRPIDSSCNGGADITGPIELTDVANIAAGSRIVYTVTGVVDPDICPSYPCTGVHLTNSATVTMPAGTDDPNGGDNTDTDVDTLSPRVDLSITKTDGISVIQGLAGASSVAVAPDGTSVYATGLLGDGVAAFARDTGTGELEFLEAERDSVNGVDGLNGAAAVAVSPDGEHVYVAGSTDNAVAVFARDGATGELEFLERVQSGVGGFTSMLGPSGLEISADGRFLYVAAANSSSIAILGRDAEETSATFGLLSFVAAVSDGAGGVDGLGLARAVRLSPNGQHLYAVGESDSGIAAFSRDAGTGALTFLGAWLDGVGGVSGLSGARALAIAPDGGQVYVAAATADAIVRFSRVTDTGSPDFGKLSFGAALIDGVGGIDGLDGASGVAMAPAIGADPGGQHVYVTGAAEDALAVFARDAGTGALTPVAVEREGTGGVSGLDGPSALAVSPDGAQVYATGANAGSVVAFDRDWDSGSETGTGELTFIDVARDGGGTVAPGTEITYVITVTNNGPSAVRGAVITDIFPGELEDVHWECFVFPTPPGAACLNGLSGDGDLVKPVNLPPGGSVRIEATGTIKPGVVGTISNTATVSEPDGVIDLAPSNNSATDSDTVLGRRADLEVTKIACTDPLDCAATETTTAVPGATVYYQVRVENFGPSDVQGATVADVLPEALVNSAWTCAAAPVAGLLSNLEVVLDGAAVDAIPQACAQPDVTAVQGLAGARALALSPDGLDLYVAGAADDGVAAFRRDLRNGSLAFVQATLDGDPVRDGACTVTGSVDGLDQASGVAVSPDGAHVYATGAADDGIAAFQRDSATGRISFLGLLRDGVLGVNGLGNVRGLAISPDGLHVYTAAPSDNGVGIFARDAGSGLLTYLGLRFDGQPEGPLTVDGLAGASAVAVSPDGTHVYVAGSGEGGGVAVFERNAGSGLLTFVEAEKDGSNGVDGLGGASALAVSEDGRHVYVTGATDGGVAVFRRDAATGALEFEAAELETDPDVSGLAGAAGVAVAADGEHVYVAGATGGTVAIFHRDPVSGGLTFLEAAVDGGGGIDGIGGAAALLVSPDGDQVYVAGATDDAVAALARGDGSRCTPQSYGDIVDVVDIVAGGTVTYLLEATLAPAAVGTLTNVATVTAPDDTFDPVEPNDEAVLVLDLVPHVDLTMTKDDGQTTAIPGLPLTYTITISNAGPSDLVGAEVEDLFPAIFLDAEWTCVASGALGQIDLETQGVAGVAGLEGPRALVLAPDPDGALGPEPGGEHVYVASRGSNAVTLFERDTVTGLLSFVTAWTDGVGGIDGLGGAGGLAISPDGKHLYATGATDGALAVFERDATTGLLTPIEVQLESSPAVDGLAGAVAVTLSPDGRSVYVVSRDDDSLAVFARDRQTGKLTFVEREKDGFGDLELLVIAGATSVAVTPDGRQVLVAGADSDTLAVFDRDTDTGAVDFRTVFRDGQDGVLALDLPESIVVSPAGGYVYVAALADDAIAIFEREAATGEITYLAEVRDGVGGVEGLDGVRSLSFSSDGLHLAAAGYNDDAVALFRRDGFTGLLTERGWVKDGVGGVNGLDGARGVALAPDGESLYAVGDLDHSLVAIDRFGLARCTPAGSGDVVDTIDIEVGGWVEYTIQGFVDPAATGHLVNTVEATMAPPTVNEGDTSATDDDLLTPVAALSIVKDDFQTEAIPGTSVIYLITVANAGPSNAPATQVSDPLPAEVTGATWTCEGQNGGVCAASGSGALAELVDLPVGSSVVFAFVASIDPAASGSLTNTATVMPNPVPPPPEGVFDPDLGDNTSSDTDTLVPHSDLAVDKTIDDATPQPGGAITFTLTVTVGGPSAGFGVQVIDLLPAGLTNVAASGTGWTCAVAPTTVTCDADATLPLGAAPPIQVTADAPLAAGTYVNAAAVTSAGIDSVPANDSDTVEFTVGEAATVTGVDLVPATSGAVLDELETALALTGGAKVTFSGEMNDPVGDTGADDVTNPANYLWVEAGDDGVFSTVACPAPAGDDRHYPVSAVAYDAPTHVATLTLLSPTPLRDGLYRLFVCDAITDLGGLELDGDDDGFAGGDFDRHFRVRVDNRLSRPHFDFDTDLAPWTLVEPAGGDISHDATQDGKGFPLSGSAHFVNPTGGTLLGMRQCLAGVPATSYFVIADIRFDVPPGSDVVVRGAVDLYPPASGACSGGVPVRRVALTTTDTGGTWGRLSGYVPNLASGGGAWVSVVFEVETPTGAPLDVWLDNLSFVAVLFADDFESGNFIRWAGTVP